jgi:hypothetical protein
MDDEEARAIIQTGPPSVIRRVRIGDDIGGWKVSQIEPRRLVLSLEDRLATFTMFRERGTVARQQGNAAREEGNAPAKPLEAPRPFVPGRETSVTRPGRGY